MSYWMPKILDKLFGNAEEINGAGRCPTYLWRWYVLSTRWFKVYLHHFVGDDWSFDLHDHPKRFISIGLWGQYDEYQSETDQTFNSPERYRAPWIRSFPAEHKHRLTMVDGGECWTLVIVLRATREWGFWHEGQFINWRRYVNGDQKHIADKMKACN